MDTMIYAGTVKGLVALRWTNGGTVEEAHRGLAGWGVEAVAVHPSAPNRVLAGTRGDGVWVSEDFGASWTKPCYGKRGPGKVRCLALDPSNPRRVYAGCEPIDVFVSDDLGGSWQPLDSIWDFPHVATVSYPTPRVEPHVRDITIDPTDSDTMYVALQVGYMLKTTDGGKNWTLLDRDLDCDVHTIVIDPRDTRKVVIATGGGESRKGTVKGRSLYVSRDGGESWGSCAMNFPQEYSVPLVMNPANPDVLYSALAHGNPGRWNRAEGADSVLIRTRDGGEHWERLERGISDRGTDYPAAIAVDEQRSDSVLIGFKSGEVFLSEDAGDSWSIAAEGLPEISDLQAVTEP